MCGIGVSLRGPGRRRRPNVFIGTEVDVGVCSSWNKPFHCAAGCVVTFHGTDMETKNSEYFIFRVLETQMRQAGKSVLPIEEHQTWP